MCQYVFIVLIKNSGFITTNEYSDSRHFINKAFGSCFDNASILHVFFVNFSNHCISERSKTWISCIQYDFHTWSWGFLQLNVSSKLLENIPITTQNFTMSYISDKLVFPSPTWHEKKANNFFPHALTSLEVIEPYGLTLLVLNKSKIMTTSVAARVKIYML